MTEGDVGKAQQSELALRVVSALVMIIVTLLVTWIGGVWFSVFFAVIALQIFNEFRWLVGGACNARIMLAAAAALAVSMIAWHVAGPLAGAGLAAAGMAALAATELVVSRGFWAATGFGYAFLPFISMASLRGAEPAGLLAILFVFACVWATDTFAYFAGRRFGGPKLAPRISPKKTWSGFAGGLAGALAVSFAVLAIAGETPSIIAAAIALALSLACQAGDLFESWVKRRFGRKDSGAIIPGHGGVLDRVDGLIFAAGAAWLCGWATGGAALAPGSSGAALMSAIVAP